MNHGQKLMVLRLQLYTAVQELKGKELDEYFELLHEIVDSEGFHRKHAARPARSIYMDEVKEYRKKPVVIRAWKFNPENKVQPNGISKDELGNWFIRTLGGQMLISDGDWIVIGIKGEMYPVKPDIFEQLYEEVPCAQSGRASSSPSQ